jgi:NAD(P)-dependent dehydrogenase (short-subunit alcohol dehydrogenase family)
MMLRLEGKVALVTGGGSIRDGIGNGRAMCMRLSQEGAAVVVMDRTAEAAQETVNAILAEGNRAAIAVGDVTKNDDCRDAVESAVREFGRLDVLVNNVGIAGELTDVVDVTEEDWDNVLDVNLKSVMHMCKHAIPAMRKQGSGAIVNISSIASFRQADRIAYPASKGAVNAMTMALAGMHAREGIRVNCVAPGQVWTPVVAHTWAPDDLAALAAVRERRRLASLMKTEGTAWDIANAVLFFACDESKWVTGQTILVDGGLHIGRPPSTE